MQATLGDRIRGKRNEKRLTQKELARRAGLNPKTVSLLETGQSGGMYFSLLRIAEELGVTLDYLERGHAQEGGQ